MFGINSYIPTLNRMGYMSPSLDKVQMAFVNYCEDNPSGLFLDIGCGFGIATLAVVEKKRHIIACDLDQRHLDILISRVPKKKKQFLKTRVGHFPNTLLFQDNAFEAINLSMVLHFLPPETIEKTFRSLFFYLKEGGRLFITTSSPYQRVLSSFVSTYERKRSVEEWPGHIQDIAQYVPHRAHLLPKGNIVFCIHELRRLALKFGFHVLDSTFFSREEIPPDLKLDGREYSGLICEKLLKSPLLSLEKTNERLPIHAANII